MRCAPRLAAACVLTATLAALGPGDATSGDADSERLTPTNYADREVVRQPVVLLRGAAPADATDVVVTNESSTRDTHVLHGIARKGRFLALAELVPGENRLVLRAAAAERPFVLVYRPQTNPRVVRCVYLTDRTGDTAYQTPREHDPQDYAGRLDTAMKLLQCFTAERMHDLGFGRVTFRLELDAGGRVPVHVVRGERPAADEYTLDDQAWWREVGDLVRRRLPNPNAKSVVVAAYTRFDPATRKVHGHTALGGGDLGLFGSAGMFAWPSRLDDVFPAFADATPVDGSRVHDDSAGRSTYWGLASTTLGAVLHEMGHTFDLPHTNAPMDIMTRGFDRLNRAFSLVEPPGKSGGAPREFKDDEVACFAPISAASLRWNPWFASDPPPDPKGEGPSLSYENPLGVKITAPQGIRYVALMREGRAIAYCEWFRAEDPTWPPPTETWLDSSVILRAEGAATSFRVVDSAGASIAAPVEVPAMYVRRWRLQPRTRPWPDPSRFIDLDPMQTMGTPSGKELRSPTAYVNLLSAIGRDSHDVVAYAGAQVKARKRGKYRLRTGSDDALRLWIDGKLVQSSLVLRGAHPDDDSADVDLDAGTHAVLVEVSQRGGGWGFYVRFDSEDGLPLHVEDDGSLSGGGGVAFLDFPSGGGPDLPPIRAVLDRAGIRTGWSQSVTGSLLLARADFSRAHRALRADPLAAPIVRRIDAWKDGDAPFGAGPAR